MTKKKTKSKEELSDECTIPVLSLPLRSINLH